MRAGKWLVIDKTYLDRQNISITLYVPRFAIILAVADKWLG